MLFDRIYHKLTALVQGGTPMKSIFSYDSKFNQILITVADLIMLNILFLICCIPLITIGAAQAGLYNGIRQMMNKEDDTSVFKAFFRGFRSGFKRITIVHTVLLLIMLVLTYNLFAVLVLQLIGEYAPLWVCYLALIICAIYHSMLAPFHATFECTTKQLVKNVFFVIMAHPLCAFWTTILVWFPVILAVLNFYAFLQAFPLWCIIYYSLAYLFSFTVIKKPFKTLENNFYASVVANMESNTQDVEGEVTESEPTADTEAQETKELPAAQEV